MPRSRRSPPSLAPALAYPLAALCVLSAVLARVASAQARDPGTRIWTVRYANSQRDYKAAADGAHDLLADPALEGKSYADLRADAWLQLYFANARLGDGSAAEKAYRGFLEQSAALAAGHRLIDQMVELREAFGAESTGLRAAVSKPFVPPDDATWKLADPREQGLDVKALAELAQLSDAAGGDALLVVHRGRIVHETYTRRYREPMMTMSSVKSMTGLLTGLAIADGKIASVHDKVGKYVPSWREGRRGEVTIEHLLTMSSGLPRMRTDGVPSAKDKNAFVLALAPHEAPGTRFAYTNEGVQLLGAVLAAALGKPLTDYAAERLFEPCGMRGTSLRTDSAGNAIAYADAKTTLRDFARLGVVMLQDGKWQEREVVPPAWIAASLRPSARNTGYGYLWWLYDGVCAMEGYLATSVWILKDRDLVVARVQARPSLLAPEPLDERKARALMARIAPAR